MKAIGLCPDCGSQIVTCDNSVRLDYPAVRYDEVKSQWTIMTIGGMDLACVGDPGFGNLGHSLHEHQPPEAS